MADNFFLKADELEIEKQQLEDEGKNYKELFRRIDELIEFYNRKKIDEYREKLINFYKKVINFPERKNFPFSEPSDVKEIEKEIYGKWEKEKELSEKEIEDRILGAWFGRCVGCFLGKIVEGKKINEIHGYLKETERYPLNYYFTGKGVDEKTIEKYKLNKNLFVENINFMPEDDDINYTVSHLLIYRYRSFETEEIANFYLSHMPFYRVYTAERTAYRNLVNGIYPPLSSIYFNPYREWIGAQIRGDFSGYINIGSPSIAIKMAWKDGMITHIKNGIYGEMWVSALLSISPFFKSNLNLIKNSINFIPEKSRLKKGIKEIISIYEKNATFEDVMEIIHKKWDEKNLHHWCHTISNAQIVCAGILWGENDFRNSICKAVMCGFDTDCNGATVGSVLGLKNGFKKIPSDFITPLNDTVLTGISRSSKLKISELAEKTLKIIKKRRRGDE